MRQLETQFFDLELSLEEIDGVLFIRMFDSVIRNSVSVELKSFFCDFIVNVVKVFVYLFRRSFFAFSRCLYLFALNLI